MGPRSRAGFTFIEILIVMIVIGILAGLAYLRLQSQKDKATLAAMTSDLRAIAEEQEAHYFQHRVYSSDLVALNARPSPDDVIVIVEATSAGWSGRISNPRVSKQCYIVVGQAAPIGSATQDGVISCS
ncbi:MAG TPA: prepilin-type N-terminal cleavage/methylation domain-containing protein [Gemmatimonadales bacterium]|nr:prepilin-type N-terminal cleavage/methylation domain-containing protein [Gemmatimonadales bacterium]